MKKLTFGMMAILTTACCFGGCDVANLKDTLLGKPSGEEVSLDTSSQVVFDEESSSIGGATEETPKTYLYNAFTPDEKRLYETHVGEVIPFLPNDEYYVKGYYAEIDYENGMCVYMVGNTKEEFDAYRKLYASYSYIGEADDAEGHHWYYYQKGDVFVITCFYIKDGKGWVVTYAQYRGEGDGETPDVEGETPDDGSDEKPDDEKVSGEGEEEKNDDEKVPDEGGDDVVEKDEGVRVVDFTKATNVKNVADQGYYKDGCPTTGKIKVLVIPVEFSNATAASKGYTTQKLDTIFNGGAGSTDYYSVKEYYRISSYGKLDLEFEVLDSWFRPNNTSNYYKNATMGYYEDKVDIGDQMIMDEALAYLEGRMDLSEFDSDGNGIIDAVVMINTLDINVDEIFHWAYRYWNIYADENDYYYEYDGVSANDYMWASYQFILECYDEYGDVWYNNSTMNPYTYIHEFGHILGADDYYDAAEKNEPMGGYDIMDAMMGDHNAYSKFNYGWLTTARLITAENSTTLTLESFTETGDAVIIANNWDDKLGAYQEYFIVVYYTNTGLNSGEGGYFAREGIMVYHVNATLQRDTSGGVVSYDVKYNNTDASNAYGTVNNLLELVKSADGSYLFEKNDTLSTNTKTDSNKKIAYVLTVNDITEEGAIVTFCKNS